MNPLLSRNDSNHVSFSLSPIEGDTPDFEIVPVAKFSHKMKNEDKETT